jgi:hypothetical protein
VVAFINCRSTRSSGVLPGWHPASRRSAEIERKIVTLRMEVLGSRKEVLFEKSGAKTFLNLSRDVQTPGGPNS